MFVDKEEGKYHLWRQRNEDDHEDDEEEEEEEKEEEEEEEEEDDDDDDHDRIYSDAVPFKALAIRPIEFRELLVIKFDDCARYKSNSIFLMY